MIKRKGPGPRPGRPAGRGAWRGATRSATGRNPAAVTGRTICRGRYQPRLDLREDTLQDLAESIPRPGVVQPLLVRPLGEDRYELIAGERRWRAAQLAGFARGAGRDP